jgi:hypothetical protein
VDFEGKRTCCFLGRLGSDTDIKGWQVGLKTVFLNKKVKIIGQNIIHAMMDIPMPDTE